MDLVRWMEWQEPGDEDMRMLDKNLVQRSRLGSANSKVDDAFPFKWYPVLRKGLVSVP